jgi:hypothetical protein
MYVGVLKMECFYGSNMYHNIPVSLTQETNGGLGSTAIIKSQNWIEILNKIPDWSFWMCRVWIVAEILDVGFAWFTSGKCEIVPRLDHDRFRWNHLQFFHLTLHKLVPGVIKYAVKVEEISKLASHCKRKGFLIFHSKSR